MTEAMVDDALVEVTPEDREAAAPAYPTLSISIMSGDMDESENVQAFARHRLAGVAAGREEAAKVCDDLATTAASIQAALELVGTEAPTKSVQRETAETLATAIRQRWG